MKINNRRSVNTELKDYCAFSKEHDFLEVTEWINGEGFDVNVSSRKEQMFQLTWGEFKALKKVIKFMNKPEED